MSNSYILANPAKWLKDIAVRVDELVQDDAAREWFKARLAEWRQSWQRNEYDFIPDRALTLPEQYVRMAAIHDVVCERAQPLDIWNSACGKGPNHCRECMPFLWLCKMASDIAEDDRDTLERCLANVAADLRNRGANDQPADPSGEAGGQKTEKWPTVAEVERYTAVNRGVISRAADSGVLQSNGLKGRARRITPQGLIDWCRARQAKGEPTESVEHVEALVRKHVSD